MANTESSRRKPSPSCNEDLWPEATIWECRKFFKWIESYKKMVEGMSLHVVDEAPSDVALEHMVAAPVEMKLRSVDDGKMDKLTNWIQVLVMINIGLLLLCFIGVFVMILK
uniref:Uncharacterized protein n=1 Tax=Oryza meridionalis TaxID=40149 RepID=A0A0E0DYJ7_9ORYZ